MAVVDYLEGIIDDNLKYTGKGDEVHFNCPFCGDTRHRFYVNLSTHRCYCHNCQYGETFVTFIKDVEGCSYEKAKQRYDEIRGSAYIPEDVLLELKQNIFLPNISYNLAKRAIPLPEEYAPLDLKSKNLVNKQAIKYLQKRQVSLEQIEQHKMGYCIDGDYSHRIIIPIWENEELRFWVARAIGNKAYRKEMSPTNEDYQISKSQVIFNIYNASRIYNCAVISEGIFDACPWGDIGTSLLGKILYDDQLSILLAYKDYLQKGIYIALDYDARLDAIKMADELSQYFPVYIVNIPEGYDDPNYYARRFGRYALYSLLDTAVEYNTINRLKQKFFIF